MSCLPHLSKSLLAHKNRMMNLISKKGSKLEAITAKNPRLRVSRAVHLSTVIDELNYGHFNLMNVHKLQLHCDKSLTMSKQGAAYARPDSDATGRQAAEVLSRC